jgi:SAM-dependent methyltransferase
MPSVDSNLVAWGRRYGWPEGGDEWSAWWGGSDAMWVAALLPRIQSFVPTATVLEIGPGFGRWTRYLKDLADHLVIVDLVERCIDNCRARFAGATNIEFHVNDGRSLDMVPDASVDLAISIDSLVHADAGVLQSYLTALATKLTRDGVGLFHHSNLGAYEHVVAISKRMPPRARAMLERRGYIPDVGRWRDESMTASRFSELCASAGLRCVGQEKISWEGGPFMTDTLSLFTAPGSKWDRPYRLFSNHRFHDEARRMRALWAPSSFPGA